MPRLRPDGTHYPSMMPKLCAECGEKGTARNHVTAVAGVYAHAACRAVREICSIPRCVQLVHGGGMCSGHYNRRYYKDRADQMRERTRRWIRENPEKVARRYAIDKAKGVHRTRARRRYWLHRLELVAVEQNNRARRLGSVERVSFDQFRGRYEMFGGRCYLCGNEADGFDHVKPYRAGGRHIPANLRPACRSCNSKKGSKWEGVTSWLAGC